MTDVFISYASEDRDRIRDLANALKERGWSVWWDRDIVTGQRFDEVIEHVLDSAKSVVVLWSKNSIASEWVKNEAAAAAQRGVLVPAMIDPVILPLEFRRKQTADLVGWESNPKHPGFQALCDGVTNIVTGELPPRRPTVELPKARRGWRWIAGVIVGVIVVAAGLWVFRADHPDRPKLMQPAQKPDPENPANLPAQAKRGDSALPFFMSRPLTTADLVGKSKWELDVMRNEIYARYGRRFARADFQTYFDQQPWYQPRYASNEFPKDLLTTVQRSNVIFINKYQSKALR